MRKCLFCPNVAKSKEHVWPDWTLRELHVERPFFRRQGEKLGLRVLDPEPRIKWVCSQCNLGWMSDLESLFRGISLPLIRGKEASLSISDQQVMTRWFLKTTMIFEALAGKNHEPCYEERDRSDIRIGSAFPSDVLVWLGRWTDSDLLACIGLLTATVGGQPFKVYNGCVTTLAIGQLLVQVVNLHIPWEEENKVFSIEESREAPWGDALVTIFPADGVKAWPPRVDFTPTGKLSLLSLASRFGGDFV